MCMQWRHGRVEIQVHSFVTSASYGVEWSWLFYCFGNSPQYPVKEAGWSPHQELNRVSSDIQSVTWSLCLVCCSSYLKYIKNWVFPGYSRFVMRLPSHSSLSQFSICIMYCILFMFLMYYVHSPCMFSDPQCISLLLQCPCVGIYYYPLKHVQKITA